LEGFTIQFVTCIFGFESINFPLVKKTSNADLERISIDKFKAVQKIPVVVVLDNVRSMHNVGAAFRTADAFIIEKIYLTGITAKPPHREINKTALGATESVEWEYAEDTLEVITKLKETGYTIISVEQAKPHVSLEHMEVEKETKYCLVFGNEVFGVKDEIINISDLCLEIPQMGTKHSLNISVTIGIVLWKMFEAIKLPELTNN